MPTTDSHAAKQQLRLLRSIQAESGDYLGGVVICSGWPDHLLQELIAVVAQLSLPVILVDRNPPPGSPNLAPKLSYVCVNDAAGGELAAEAVMQLSEESPIKRILVIAGFAKLERYRSFRRRIKSSKRLRGCEIIITEDGKFDRWVAESITYNLVTEAIERHRPFDIIFCIADSMTLGCLDAIARITNWHGHLQPKVIGYDGTASTRNFVENRRSRLVRVVVQDSKEIARRAVSQLILLSQSKSEEPTVNVLWVAPYLYPRVQRG